MTTGYQMYDPIMGSKDLADEFITDAWLVDKYVGNTMFTWGSNYYGELGLGSSANSYSSPVQVGALTTWKQVSMGQANMAAIKTDGTLWTCGYGLGGSNGQGNQTGFSVPTQVGTLTNWKYVSFNTGSPGLWGAIKTDGTLWACGTGAGSGNNNTASYSSPIQVGTATTWKQVSYGSTIGGVQTNGTLWTWGAGGSGQIGNGAFASYSSPIQVGTATTWKQVSIVSNTAAAIKTDGTLWTWGTGTNGQMGNGAIASYSSPIQVGSMTNWKQVTTGASWIAAIKTDGTLWVWGSNPNGELGMGTITTQYSSPIQVGALTNWKQVTSGLISVAAIKTDGSLWTWGDVQTNAAGNVIGVGYYSSPVQVGSLTNWKYVSSTLGYGIVGAITYTEIQT